MTSRLTRLPLQGKIAGVCAGVAAYLDTDVTIVRIAWIVFSIVPGALIGGVLAYVAAWILMPVADTPPLVRPGARRLFRARLDKKIGGVCAGFARYFDIDPTAVRVAWVILSIYPGAIICGVVAYVVAWLIIPAEPLLPMEPSPAAA